MKLTQQQVIRSAVKRIENDEYVEVFVEVWDYDREPARPKEIVIQRCWMGYQQWVARVSTPKQALEECKHWGLDGWEQGQYGV